MTKHISCGELASWGGDIPKILMKQVYVYYQRYQPKQGPLIRVISENYGLHCLIPPPKYGWHLMSPVKRGISFSLQVTTMQIGLGFHRRVHLYDGGTMRNCGWTKICGTSWKITASQKLFDGYIFDYICIYLLYAHRNYIYCSWIILDICNSIENLICIY